MRRARRLVSATSGVVLARTAGGYRVHTDAGEIIATLRGKLKYKDSGRVVPGDVVVLEGSAIAEIRPRRSVLARRAAQGSSGAGPRRHSRWRRMSIR
jgi:putative ribosome biogenesis GTPase RsgA